MGGSGRRGRKDGKAVKTEVEGGVLRNSRRRQAKKRGERRTINNTGDGETLPTLRIKSKIKTFHTINKPTVLLCMN